MKAAVVVFPGSNCDEDCRHVLADVLGVPTARVWHKETALPDVDLVVLPGGFSYGDYLRAGAIARFSPVMSAVIAHARRGGLVFGICNGFQILTEAGLLPGALLRNRDLRFVCQDAVLRVDNAASPATSQLTPGDDVVIPVAHAEGRFHIDPDGLRRLEGEGQVMLRYVDDDGRVRDEAALNGSLASIAGISAPGGRVSGMMPHPERCAEAIVGGPAADHANLVGRFVFEGILAAAAEAA